MIAIASDHAGYALKKTLIEHLAAKGVAVDDLGCGGEPADYPVYAEKLCKAVAAGQYERGILVCGTGIGMSIAANKMPGIRAALCGDCFSAAMSRQHNDANVLCLGGRVVGAELAKMIVDTYLDTGFSNGESHIRRIGQLKALER